MGERIRAAQPEDMATTSTAVSIVPQQLQEESVERMAVITLRPTSTHTETRKKVVWTEDTVDNEHMNKKKSKCCCIYEKPRKFDESDSESSEDEECEHCFGHVEKKQHRQHHRAQEQTLTINEPEDKVEAEPTATLKLQPPAPAPPPPDEDNPTTS